MKIRFYAQHNNLSSVECWNFPDYLVTAKVYYKKLLKMVFKPATGKIYMNWRGTVYSFHCFLINIVQL